MAKLTLRSHKRFGWIPDLPDSRDRCFSIAAPVPTPPRIDLTDKCPPIVDQSRLGSCTSNAIAGAIGFDQIKQGIAPYPVSRLFIYYQERLIEGTVGQDAGAMIRDGIKAVNKIGAPHETLWPYSISKFTRKPPAAAYSDAKKHLALQYSRVSQKVDFMRQVLASGFPFVAGFSVFESFESDAVARTGTVPMPNADEQLLGGHAVLAVGYDDASKRFIMRNSWGTGWGKKGYFTMPYAYLSDPNLSEDFWQISLIQA
jgi:C1A family cysteine protease